MKNDHAKDCIAPRSFRFAYGPRYRTPISFPKDSPYTDQSGKDDADINTIMRRYQSTGDIPHLNTMQCDYMDVTGHDFLEHQKAIRQATELFDAMPSAIRERFANSPAAFLDFTSNEANQIEMAHMGLFSPEYTNQLLNPNEPTTEA